LKSVFAEQFHREAAPFKRGDPLAPAFFSFFRFSSPCWTGRRVISSRALSISKASPGSKSSSSFKGFGSDDAK
jgi:hypothetical protein